VTTSARHRSARVHRQRRLAALAALLLLGAILTGVIGCCAGATGGPAARNATHGRTQRRRRRSPPELPRGGRELPELPHRGVYTAPRRTRNWALWVSARRRTQSRASSARRARYARKTRPVLPALELLAVIAHSGGRATGALQPAPARRRDPPLHSRPRARPRRCSCSTSSPGARTSSPSTTRLRKWLREPDVGLALDPEWHVQAGQIPGQVIGTVSAKEVNATSAWLAQLVAKHNLPQKLFLVHQFTPAWSPCGP
jgi:hypothetical protein